MMSEKLRERPKVLLLGNGLNLAYMKQASSWKKLVRTGGSGVPDDLVIPLSLEVVLRTKDRARDFMKEQSRALYGVVDSEELFSSLRALLKAGFDEILTTNYGYELESAALGVPEISEYRLKKIVRSTTGRVDSRFLLHTYNEVETEGTVNRIWHVHGEAKKPVSMVIDHYQYGSLLNRFVNFYRWRGNDYRTYKDYTEIPKESWLDAFMMGDVYILGQGLDFAEMDLWWLIDRKKLEKNARGRIFFYEPKSDREYDGKIELLKLYGVQTNTLGFELPEKPTHRAPKEKKAKYEAAKNEVFREFYRAAIEDIVSRVSGAARQN